MKVHSLFTYPQLAVMQAFHQRTPHLPHLTRNFPRDKIFIIMKDMKNHKFQLHNIQTSI